MLGRRNFVQETYKTNLTLLDGLDRWQKLTGGLLQWINLKLMGFEAALELLWELVYTGVFETQEGGGGGQGQETSKRAESPDPRAVDQGWTTFHYKMRSRR